MMVARNDGSRIGVTIWVREVVGDTPRFEIDARLGGFEHTYLNAKLKSYEEFTNLYKKIISLDLTQRDEYDGKGGEATFLQFKKNEKSQSYAYYYTKKNHTETCEAINKLLSHLKEQILPNEQKVAEVAERKQEVTQPQIWKNTKGESIKASFVSLEDEKITLRKEDGKTYSFPISLLSEQSIEQARMIHAESSKEP